MGHQRHRRTCEPCVDEIPPHSRDQRAAKSSLTHMGIAGGEIDSDTVSSSLAVSACRGYWRGALIACLSLCVRIASPQSITMQQHASSSSSSAVGGSVGRHTATSAVCSLVRTFTRLTLRVLVKDLNEIRRCPDSYRTVNENRHTYPTCCCCVLGVHDHGCSRGCSICNHTVCSRPEFHGLESLLRVTSGKTSAKSACCKEV